MSKKSIGAEFARRVIEFHPNDIENPFVIEYWGLFRWGDISKLVKSGEVILEHGYSSMNKTVWCKPSEKFYNNYVKPLMSKTLSELNKLAGWED